MSSVNGDNSSGSWLGYLWGSSNNVETEEDDDTDDTTEVDQTQQQTDRAELPRIEDQQVDPELEHLCEENCPAHLQQQQQRYANFWSNFGFCGEVGAPISFEDDNGEERKTGGWTSYSAEMQSESPTRFAGTPHQEYVQGDWTDDPNG